MKNLIIILLILIFTGNTYAQEYLAIRKKIIPLHTNRNEVEKLARFVKNFTLFVRYETDGEFLDVFYSQEKCVGHGWNVLKDTVLNFRSYPKRDLKLEDILKTNSKLSRFSDDTLSSYYVDQSEGRTFIVRSGEQIVEYIGFSPTETGSNLRCNGFPKFNLVSEHYSPYQTFNVKNVANWDAGLVYDSIKRIKTDQKGFIFVYCKSENLAECKKLKKNIEDFIYGELKEKPQKVSVIWGGLRDNNEIETFIISKDYPPPVVRPTLPLN